MREALVSSTRAEVVEPIFRDFGIPGIVGSGNGPEFDNQMMSAVLERMGVEKRTSSPYCPQSKASRAVQNALQVIREGIAGEGRRWSSVLPAAQIAINTKVRRY